MTPEVSVIIPTYNRCAMLREAIDSVRAQSFRAYELIVIDDGSTDATAEHLARPEVSVPLPPGEGVRG